jgi:predicted Abi (CAAX) family protease
MALIDDWREKHLRKSGKGRLIMYIILLVFILFLILKADTFVNGFSRIFFSPDSSAALEENHPG